MTRAVRLPRRTARFFCLSAFGRHRTDPIGTHKFYPRYLSMKRSTLKHLGNLLRQETGLEDEKGAKELQGLIEQLERRERELRRMRAKAAKPKRK
jgi:hypothetical protein